MHTHIPRACDTLGIYTVMNEIHSLLLRSLLQRQQNRPRKHGTHVLVTGARLLPTVSALRWGQGQEENTGPSPGLRGSGRPLEEHVRAKETLQGEAVM